ncbi:MAG: hypothetical protein Q7J23_04745 [Nitrosomonas sp.]|nr:hypothetical protein [Nitrosomonas sp.]
MHPFLRFLLLSADRLPVCRHKTQRLLPVTMPASNSGNLVINTKNAIVNINITASSS